MNRVHPHGNQASVATFLHGRKDKCQHHWHPFQTDLMWNISTTLQILLDSILFVCLSCFNSSNLSVFKKIKLLALVEIQIWKYFVEIMPYITLNLKNGEEGCFNPTSSKAYFKSTNCFQYCWGTKCFTITIVLKVLTVEQLYSFVYETSHKLPCIVSNRPYRTTSVFIFPNFSVMHMFND